MNVQRDIVDGAHAGFRRSGPRVAGGEYFREMPDFKQRHDWMVAESRSGLTGLVYNERMRRLDRLRARRAARGRPPAKLEALGLILILLLILAITITRSWHHFSWSAR